MEALGRDLVKFLYTAFPDFYESQIGPFMQALYQEEFDRDCETFISWGEIDLQTINDQVKQLRDMKREEAQQRGVPMLDLDIDEGKSLVGTDGEEEMTLTLDKEGGGLGYRSRARQRQAGHQAKLMEKMLAQGDVKAGGARKSSATGTKRIRVRPSSDGEDEAKPQPKKKSKTTKSGKKKVRKKKSKKKKKKGQPFLDKAIIIGALLLAAWHFGLSKKVLDLIFPEDEFELPVTKSSSVQAAPAQADETQYSEMSEGEFFDSVDQTPPESIK